MKQELEQAILEAREMVWAAEAREYTAWRWVEQAIVDAGLDSDRPELWVAQKSSHKTGAAQAQLEALELLSREIENV
jgi:hypothetical protein